MATKHSAKKTVKKKATRNAAKKKIATRARKPKVDSADGMRVGEEPVPGMRLLMKILNEHTIRNPDKQQQLIDHIRSAKLLSKDNALIEPAAVLVQLLAKQIPLLQKSIDKLDEKIEAEMKKHPDAALFTVLPGAGKALAPRLLTAFGSQRDRYASAEQVATFSGIAPVTKQSGKTRIVHRRFARRHRL